MSDILLLERDEISAWRNSADRPDMLGRCDTPGDASLLQWLSKLDVQAGEGASWVLVLDLPGDRLSTIPATEYTWPADGRRIGKSPAAGPPAAGLPGSDPSGVLNSAFRRIVDGLSSSGRPVGRSTVVRALSRRLEFDGLAGCVLDDSRPLVLPTASRRLIAPRRFSAKRPQYAHSEPAGFRQYVPGGNALVQRVTALMLQAGLSVSMHVPLPLLFELMLQAYRSPVVDCLLVSRCSGNLIRCSWYHHSRLRLTRVVDHDQRIGSIAGHISQTIRHLAPELRSLQLLVDHRLLSSSSVISTLQDLVARHVPTGLQLTPPGESDARSLELSPEWLPGDLRDTDWLTLVLSSVGRVDSAVNHGLSQRFPKLLRDALPRFTGTARIEPVPAVIDCRPASRAVSSRSAGPAMRRAGFALAGVVLVSGLSLLLADIVRLQQSVRHAQRQLAGLQVELDHYPYRDFQQQRVETADWLRLSSINSVELLGSLASVLTGFPPVRLTSLGWSQPAVDQLLYSGELPAVTHKPEITVELRGDIRVSGQSADIVYSPYVEFVRALWSLSGVVQVDELRRPLQRGADDQGFHIQLLYRQELS